MWGMRRGNDGVREAGEGRRTAGWEGGRQDGRRCVREGGREGLRTGHHVREAVLHRVAACDGHRAPVGQLILLFVQLLQTDADDAAATGHLYPQAAEPRRHRPTINSDRSRASQR